MTSAWTYWSARWMSVPPPSWTPNSTSTGSATCGVRSTTLVSKAMTRVATDGSEARTDPNTAEYTTDSAMEPDWSRHRTTSRLTRVCRRVRPISRSGTTVRCSGR